ncbi:MAG: glycerophosphodiester phosphodiesterase [Candidatus Kariarchaeaceae archaeon]|jgi:glycerophosphoryl diester phosphodiesterase
MYCIAHRGASGLAPENTILGFWTAIASGADIIELDVQVTKDQRLVIFHDRSLERITGDQGGVADFTLDELETKDMGKWKGDAFENTKIPTFEEVLNELPHDCSLIVEVKPQYRDVEKNRFMERGILELLDAHRGVGDGYISVRDEDTWEWLSENTKRYPIGLMQKKRSASDFLEIIKTYKIPFSQIRWRNHSDEDFSKLRGTGSKIMAFYADNPSDWDFLAKQKVHGILTNYPSLLKGYLLSHHQG